MGYYCTVPQCTSLAGKTKNVKFHRFPRDVTMADKWNIILKRGKPYTKYSKVCSLHFTQADYNVTTMGQWKTLSKDAVPSQNLPKLNPDGTVMVIRKSRTVKYRDGKKEDSDKMDKWSMPLAGHSGLLPPPPATPDACTAQEHENTVLAYRLQTLGAIANTISPQNPLHTSHLNLKPKKQDAFMQTDPVQNDDDDTQPNNSYSEVSDKSFNSEVDPYGYPKDDYPKDNYPKDNYPKDNYPKDSYQKDSSYPKDTSYPKDSYLKDSFSKDSYSKDSNYQKDGSSYQKDGYSKDNYGKETNYQQKDGNYQQKDNSYQQKETNYQQKDNNYGKPTYQKDKYEPKDYTKTSEDYIPQTNEEYNKEAEKYALERKSHNGYDMKEIYQKQMVENSYQKMGEMYQYDKSYQRDYLYQSGYPDSAELLRNQQHNLQILQETHRLSENQNFFNENHIKQEIDISVDDYERSKDGNPMYNERRLAQRLIDHMPIAVKQEPDTPNGCNVTMQPQSSPYYQANAHNNIAGGYYDPLSRPGPELLIAKQNALAAHTQLWQNMKRPFFYSETSPYNGPQLLHRYEDISRILQ